MLKNVLQTLERWRQLRAHDALAEDLDLTPTMAITIHSWSQENLTPCSDLCGHEEHTWFTCRQTLTHINLFKNVLKSKEKNILHGNSNPH